MNFQSYCRVFLVLIFSFGVLLVPRKSVYAGQYVNLSPGLDLYYEEAGSGTPIVFIPGWFATSAVFKAQIAHFSRNFRAIAYDPRNRGRSSKALHGNNRLQHGADLKAFIDALALEDVILVGYSGGCYQSWAYFRAYGVDNIKAYICIDAAPKAFTAYDGDWAAGNAVLDFKPLYEGLRNDRANTTRDFIQSLVTRPMTEEEMNDAVAEAMMTPDDIVIELMFDWFMSDFSEEVKMIDGKIPVLNVLSEPMLETGTFWLATNAPNAQVVGFGLHSMFWEFPDRFNAVVDTFLEGIR